MNFVHLSFPLLFVFQVQASYFASNFFSTLIPGFSCSGEYIPKTLPPVNTSTISIEEMNTSVSKEAINELESTQPDKNPTTNPLHKTSVLQVKKRLPKKRKFILQDMTNEMGDVQVEEESTTKMNHPKKPRITFHHIKKLIDDGEYERVKILGVHMTKDKLSKCLCPAITKPEHYKALYDYLKYRDMLSNFLIYGNIEVAKEVIPNIQSVHVPELDNMCGIFTAIDTCIIENRHERAIELYGNAMSMKNDPLFDYSAKRSFIRNSIGRLAFLMNGMLLKRFLTLHGDEFASKYPKAFEIFCGVLAELLQFERHIPLVEKSLIDFIGQPNLLTPQSFSKRFLYVVGDFSCFITMKYGWREVIEEGLNRKCYWGGLRLWRAMKKEHPSEYTGEYPDTKEALDAVLAHFLTKEQTEMEWAEKNAPMLFNKLKNHEPTSYLFPDVLWLTISNYAVSWTDIDNSTFLANESTIRLSD